MSRDRKVDVDTRSFFGISEVTRILPKAEINLTDHSYLPKVVDRRSDWVASLLNAFKNPLNLVTVELQ